jgi:hypothetical protein
VHADHVIGVESSLHRGDDRTGVVSVGAVALIAKPLHELSPRLCGALRVPARLSGRPEEAEAGQVRDHQVKGVGRITTIGARVGQRSEQLQILHHRVGPAVGEDQRGGIRLRRADVEEVDVLMIDLGGELRELVQLRLPRAPVIAVSPVLD